MKLRRMGWLNSRNRYAVFSGDYDGRLLPSFKIPEGHTFYTLRYHSLWMLVWNEDSIVDEQAASMEFTDSYGFSRKNMWTLYHLMIQ